jgi:hypothetical protein
VNPLERGVVTQFGSGSLNQVPAQKTGGLYKTFRAQVGFVEAVPSRVFRDGAGIFGWNLGRGRTRV